MAIDRSFKAPVGKLFVIAVLLSSPCWGGDGDPVAIRFWDKGVATVETNWNLVVQLQSQTDLIHSDRPQADLQLTLDGSTVHIAGENIAEQQLPLSKLDSYLDRVENEDEVHWTQAADATFVSPNAMKVAGLDGKLLVLSVDGLNLLVVGRQQPQELKAVVEVLKNGNLPTFDAILELDPDADSRELAEVSKARMVVRASPKSSGGNTVAISRRKESATDGAPPEPAIVELGFEPWEMPEELRELFQKKEEACRASQQVFAKLSVAQLNFKPSNGTHTPRWNVEHMMGRELLFFSQIYAAVDSAIPVVDLNPKQMPPDYVAAHPNWTGKEEARQMERVLAFTSRYAYLLQGMDLDKKPVGSFWTPRGLLKQMQRHYNEHTANVVKKFELEDWPKE